MTPVNLHYTHLWFQYNYRSVMLSYKAFGKLNGLNHTSQEGNLYSPVYIRADTIVIANFPI